MEEWSYTSTHPLGHTGPVTGSLYHFYLFTLKLYGHLTIILNKKACPIFDTKNKYEKYTFVVKEKKLVNIFDTSGR